MHVVEFGKSCHIQCSFFLHLKLLTNKIKNKTGVTKHRNGTERNGIYRNEPEYTGTRRNDAGMKGNGQEWNRNGQEWNRNVPERAGMTPKYTEISRNETGMNTNMVG